MSFEEMSVTLLPRPRETVQMESRRCHKGRTQATVSISAPPPHCSTTSTVMLRDSRIAFPPLNASFPATLTQHVILYVFLSSFLLQWVVSFDIELLQCQLAEGNLTADTDCQHTSSHSCCDSD